MLPYIAILKEQQQHQLTLQIWIVLSTFVCMVLQCNMTIIIWNVITFGGHCMPNAYFIELYVQIQYREIHSKTSHSKPWHKWNTLDICLFSWSINLCYCLVDVILPFAVSDPDVPHPPLFIFYFAPPNPSEVTAISTRVNQSQHTSVKHTRPVLCHRVSVFISSCYDFSWSLVVWCWYRWWCCACVEEYSPMVLISCHLLDEPNQIIYSPTSSTPPPPTTAHPCGTSHLQLQLPLLSNLWWLLFFTPP